MRLVNGGQGGCEERIFSRGIADRGGYEGSNVVTAWVGVQVGL
jgi:hypothetical protein